MNEQYSALKSNVSMLGRLLGQTIQDADGDVILEKVETIRKLSKSAMAGSQADRDLLIEEIKNLPNEQLTPVARAFNQFLNLTNIADQYHTISRHCEENVCEPDAMHALFSKLSQNSISKLDTAQSIRELNIELVFWHQIFVYRSKFQQSILRKRHFAASGVVYHILKLSFMPCW